MNRSWLRSKGLSAVEARALTLVALAASSFPHLPPTVGYGFMTRVETASTAVDTRRSTVALAGLTASVVYRT